jgi:hypothetical protein
MLQSITRELLVKPEVSTIVGLLYKVDDQS